jgi:signal transduction histidine kinase
MRSWLLGGFLLIAVLFFANNLGRTLGARNLRTRSRALTENAITRLALAMQISRDADRERLLIDEHIFEKDPARMAGLEIQIAAERDDLRRAIRELDTDGRSAFDEGTRSELTARMNALRDPVDRALALSRRNEDEAARLAMTAVTTQYTEIDQALDRLLALDRASAKRSLARVNQIQRRFDLIFGALSTLGVMFTLGIGLAVSGLVRRRVADQRRYAALLEARNRDLDLFAGRVAHDLRSPISNVTLATALLERRVGPDPSLDRIKRGTGRLTAMIDDLLSLSRLEREAPAGLTDPAVATGPLREDLAARSDGAAVSIDVAHAQLRCSPGLFQQILGNLVDNAIKYRRPEETSRVQVTGRATGRFYELRVADNGIGMSPDDAARAFDPFFRGHRTSDRAGTGLGLSIVKRIVQASGGEVTLESELGRGSVFTVRLPLV